MTYVVHEFWCPKCESINLVDGGDPSDLTGVDPSGCVECWKCKHVWIDEEWAEMDPDIDMECPDDGRPPGDLAFQNSLSNISNAHQAMTGILSKLETWEESPDMIDDLKKENEIIGRELTKLLPE